MAQLPKEKAEELFTNYRFILSIPNAPLGKSKDNIAKQCALIAVDESINMFIGVHKKFIELDMLKGDVEETATYIFWQEVKQEIEKK